MSRKLYNGRSFSWSATENSISVEVTSCWTKSGLQIIDILIVVLKEEHWAPALQILMYTGNGDKTLYNP